MLTLDENVKDEFTETMNGSKRSCFNRICQEIENKGAQIDSPLLEALVRAAHYILEFHQMTLQLLEGQ